jgi:dTDP-4-amino-4,6-dideoxygalactose transaminase
VFADVALGTGNLTAELATPHITPRTKAILAVHLYGQPADLDELLELTRARGLHLVEDAAQAHGATYKGRPVGGHGAFAAWSFYPGKNLGAFGDGGALTTNDPALASKVRILRNYGSPTKYVHEEAGVNSRLDSLQAAVLGVKLAQLDAWNTRRSKLAAVYDEELPRDVVQPMERGADRSSSWHLYVVRTDHRETVQAALADAGIGTVVHYPIPCHKQPVYASALQASFPNAERLGAEVLSLPMSPHHSTDDVLAICRQLVHLRQG